MSVTPALRVNGLQIAKQTTPPYAGNGGVLWTDGDTLHWTTASGRDVEMPRITGSQLLAVDDLDGVMRAQAESQGIAGVFGGAFVLVAIILGRVANAFMRERAVSRWLARQPKKEEGPYR